MKGSRGRSETQSNLDPPVHPELGNEQVGEEEGTVNELERMAEEQNHRIDKHLFKNHTQQLVSLVKTNPEPHPVLGNKRGPNVVFMTYHKR